MLSALCAVVLVLAFGAAVAQATVRAFTFTGAEQTFVVPGGVTSIHVVAIGAGGGTGGGSGGFAAQVTADVSVTPGQTLYVEVGGAGQDSGAGGLGGFNGGAAGGGGAGGGGGASDIRTSPLLTGLVPEDRLIVAAGGGGGGGTATTAGGVGGAAGSDGEEGGEASGNLGGGAGTAVAGGTGGFGNGSSGTAGQLGLGGVGGNGETGTNSGGGGGGGYYGGGGGGGGLTFGGGGGGGGSSLIPPAGLMSLASLAVAPKVEITYTLVPPSIAIVSPAGGASYTQGQVVKANYSCTPPEGTVVATCAGPVASGAALDTVALGKHTFTVSAEDADGATASQEASYNVVAAPIQPSPPTTTPPLSTPAPPDTILGSHPKASIKTKKKATVKFSFSSDIAGATFQCKLDKGKLSPCTSPQTYKKVKAGQHTFSVQAVVGAAVDPSPATFSFKVTKIKKHKKH